jgi:predicted nucleic acid-binding protein
VQRSRAGFGSMLRPPWFSSELVRVEVPRGVWRANERLLPAARQVIAGLNLIPLTAGLLDRAALLRPPELRSLDAIHLASALTLGLDLTAFVAYDRRLQTAAGAERLPVVAPT